MNLRLGVMLRQIQQNEERRSTPETTDTVDNKVPIKLETCRQNVRRQDPYIDIFTSRKMEYRKA
jgi:hypothetical protein